MFSKNNIKNILILALGFFWCSALYLVQQTYLLKYCNKEFVNLVALLYGSISMALGILIFMIIYKLSKNIKSYYILFNIFAIISSILFFGTDNKTLMSICLCTTCLFGTAGFGVGYHFSLLSLNIEKEYRGRVFSIGYGIGSILTYLFTFLPSSFYKNITCMIIILPIVIINMILVYKSRNIDIESKQIYTSNYKKYFIVLSIIVILMSLLSAISTDIVSTHIFNLDGLFANTRIYYCLGLLLAGFLVDKNKEIFDVSTIISFIFCLLSIILLNQNISPNLVIALSYFFVGFFVVFRTITFVNLFDQKRSMILFSSIGLMYSRIMEGLFVIFQKQLINNYTLLIIIQTILLCFILWVYLLYYLKNNRTSSNDKLKELVIRYKLSSQEEKVLNLLLQDLTKKEIAYKLYLSVNTIKNHVSNIYKKTDIKKMN